MLFFEYFRAVSRSNVTVELKNGVVLSGILKVVDPFLNISLENVSVQSDCPVISKMETCSVRGSSIKLIRLKPCEPADSVLMEGTRLKSCLGK